MASTLAAHPLFRVQDEHLPTDARITAAYRRAKLLLTTYNLSATDIEHCSDRFWALFLDPVCCLDIAMFTVLAIHVNLAIGTLSRHLDGRSDLRPLVDELLRFDKVGLLLLTERGHGLDAFNIETTSTRQSDGSYILNTPREEASNDYTIFQVSKIALVMARLLENGQDLGCHYFIVPICNKKRMYQGVTSIRLPPRSGTTPLDFSITSFDHVRLPSTALISSTPDHISAPANPLAAWWDENWRIQLGSLLMPCPLIYGLKISAYIAGRYSMNRRITDRKGTAVPIFKYRTQQWPIVSAVTVVFVLDNWYRSVIREVRQPELDGSIRHAMAVVAKLSIIRHIQRIIPELAERCGAQANFMARIENDAKGAAIAEGDLLGLSIRLFPQLLLGRCTLDLPPAAESLLAQHAHGLIAENKVMLDRIVDHRSAKFDALILPQSQSVIEAIGHALAYSHAKKAKLSQAILDVYECAVMRQDAAWYSEIGIVRCEQRLREDRAVEAILPNVEVLLEELNVAAVVMAPIVSPEAWRLDRTSIDEDDRGGDKSIRSHL
ncbi:acyl-CoA oxidase [Hymenopellis radicata]|nr:acyl-CoA oxidase [Hymenopellis radicata]